MERKVRLKEIRRVMEDGEDFAMIDVYELTIIMLMLTTMNSDPIGGLFIIGVAASFICI